MESAKQAMDLLLENTDPSPRITLFKRFYRLDLFMSFCRTPLVAKKNGATFFLLPVADGRGVPDKDWFSPVMGYCWQSFMNYHVPLNVWDMTKLVSAGEKTPGFGLADARRNLTKIWRYGCKFVWRWKDGLRQTGSWDFINLEQLEEKKDLEK